MKNFMKILAVSLVLAACGDNKELSSTSALTNDSFSTTYANNMGKDFDTLTNNADLAITKAYLHMPTNNLYGNRLMVVDFNVKNENFDKKIEAAFDGKWHKSSWANVPQTGPLTGTSYVRYLTSEAGRDSFSLIIHDYVANQSPRVELKVVQGQKESYVKIVLREQDVQAQKKLSFSVADKKDEVTIDSISAEKKPTGTILKIDLDVKDLDARKLFQIECFDCTGGDAAKKTLSFITKAEARSTSGAIFNSEGNGRENISLFVHLPNSSLDYIRSLRLTYLAPGYFGTPTHGAYDGVFGTPYTLSVRLGN